MGKRDPYRDNIDPEYRRWGRVYPKFPGVAECVRLIKARKAHGAWSDIIAFELAQNAKSCFGERVEVFRSDANIAVRLKVIAALEMAHLPESVPFFAEVLSEGELVFTPYVRRALKGIDTPESRKLLWEAGVD